MAIAGHSATIASKANNVDQSQRAANMVRNLGIADMGLPVIGMNASPVWDQVAAYSPPVQALAKEGLPAVEPLIDCLSGDQHLTRFIQFTGVTRRHGFFIVTTDRAAIAALREIFRVNTFGPKTKGGYDPPSDRTASATASRQVARRDQAVLARASPGDARKHGSPCLPTTRPRPHNGSMWLARSSSRTQLGDENGATEAIDDEAAGRREPLSGEPLRGKRNPSVAELMAKRADAIDNTETYSSLFSKMYFESMFCMTSCLATWDAKAAGPSICRRFGEWSIGTNGEKWDEYKKSTAKSLVLLADAGIGADDDSVTRDYARGFAIFPRCARLRASRTFSAGLASS